MHDVIIQQVQTIPTERLQKLLDVAKELYPDSDVVLITRSREVGRFETATNCEPLLGRALCLVLATAIGDAIQAEKDN